MTLCRLGHCSFFSNLSSHSFHVSCSRLGIFYDDLGLGFDHPSSSVHSDHLSCNSDLLVANLLYSYFLSYDLNRTDSLLHFTCSYTSEVSITVPQLRLHFLRILLPRE